MKSITSKSNVASNFYPANPSLNKNADGYVCSINITPQSITRSRNESRLDFLKRFPRKFEGSQIYPQQQLTSKNTNWQSLINQYLETTISTVTQAAKEQPKSQQQSLFSTLLQQNISKAQNGNHPTNFSPEHQTFGFLQNNQIQQTPTFAASNTLQTFHSEPPFQLNQPYNSNWASSILQNSFLSQQYQQPQTLTFQQQQPFQHLNCDFQMNQQPVLLQPQIFQFVPQQTLSQQANFQLYAQFQLEQPHLVISDPASCETIPDCEEILLKQMEENIDNNSHYNYHCLSSQPLKQLKIINEGLIEKNSSKQITARREKKKIERLSTHLDGQQYCLNVWVPSKGCVEEHYYLLGQLDLSLKSSILELKRAILGEDYMQYGVAEYESRICKWKKDDDLIKSLTFNPATVFFLAQEQHNPNCPIIKNSEAIRLTPSMEELERMSDWELGCVTGFTFENVFGRVQFMEALDLKKMVLDEIIYIVQDSVEIKNNAICQIVLYNFGEASPVMKKLKQDDFGKYCLRVEQWAKDMNIRLIDIGNEDITFQLD